MLIEPLFAHASQRPTELAVIDDKGQYTYQQLAAMAAGLGMYIGSQTTAPSVGLLIPPGAGFVASFYGTLLAGKSAVLINYLLGDHEIAHVVKDSGIDCVLTIPQLAGRLAGIEGLNIVDLTQLPSSPPAGFGLTDFPSPKADDLAA